MLVDSLWRYPVTSMLGQRLTAAQVTPAGITGDRRFALVDGRTGMVASAKQPRLRRALLTASAEDVDGTVRVQLPGEPLLSLDDPQADARLSAFLGRDVHVSSAPGAGADIARADPDEVLAHGLEAEVSAPELVLGEAVPTASFLDDAPLHVITTATLEHVGTPPARYRPNLVLRTAPGAPPFTETAWLGSTLTIGEVTLRVFLPTPRCAVPALAHGSLPADARAPKVLMAENRIDVPGFGVLPAAGVYATVERAGTITTGTTVSG